MSLFSFLEFGNDLIFPFHAFAICFRRIFEHWQKKGKVPILRMDTYFVNFLQRANILKLQEKVSVPMSKNCSGNELQKASSMTLDKKNASTFSLPMWLEQV